MSVLLDLIIIIVLAVCIFSGFKKGIILSAATVLAMIISIFLGGVVARTYAPELSEKISPYIGWITEDATDTVIANMSGTLDDIDDSQAYEIMHDSFIELGIDESAADDLADEAYQLMQGTGYDVRTCVSLVFVDVVCYIAVFVVVFAIFAAILTIIINVVGASYAMPDLKWFDWVGGPILGFIYGFIILLVFALLFKYTTSFIPEDWNLIEGSKLIGGFMKSSIIPNLLGI